MKEIIGVRCTMYNGDRQLAPGSWHSLKHLITINLSSDQFKNKVINDFFYD